MSGGGKETPRQKMIGMMYLVLTALLAMNISKDVLLAFVTIEEGLKETNHIFDEKNEVLYSTFKREMENDAVKTKPLKEKADKIKKAAAELCKFIDKCEAEIFVLTEGGNLTEQQADTFQLQHCTQQDNYDIPTHYLIGEVENPTGKGVELKKKIAEFRKLCLASVPEKEKKTFKLGLVTEDVYDHHAEMKVPWEVFNFNHTTVAASMALLASVENEIKVAESDVVSALLKQITASLMRFDAVEAKVVAPTSYIMAGEKYEADIFVSAHSSTQDPKIVINGGGSVPVEGGVGKYTVGTSAEGLKEYKGVIKVKGPDGIEKDYPFEGSYMVAKPAMAISPTKMNVFYIGVDNPVDITVAGAAPTDVVATLTGATGSINPLGQGHYIVKVSPGSPKCMINVAIKTKSKTGSGSKSMGSMEFRVKKVPSPLASFAGITGDGSASKGELEAAGGVIPKLEDFVFDLKFPVISWVMSMNINGVFVDEKASGASKTANMATMLSKARTGGKILIEQVQVQAPDGIRKVPGCVIKVK
jgi:gliding motility-associated protein GldM